MEIRFLTKNPNKAAEFAKLFEGSGYKVIPDSSSIREIQTDDMDALVRDKVIKAFDVIRRPVFVDHTGLYFGLLNGLPGGLTELFFNKLENKGIAKLIGTSEDNSVRAVTLIGYCDGKSVAIFRGELEGVIPREPRGPEGFQWDPIFIPQHGDKTFAEMGVDKKNEISMRRIAIDLFIKHLNSNDRSKN